MFIQTEATPNPNTLKFHPGVEVMPSGIADFKDKEKAAESPLAESLFAINGVCGVFFGSDFISVTKGDDGNWDTLKPHILTAVMEHFVAGRTLFSGEGNVSNDAGGAAAEDSEIVIQIRELIDSRVRPAVAEDGGDIVYRDFVDGVVKLELYGACSGCPSSTVTLKDGIENMLKHYIPEVLSVEAING